MKTMRPMFERVVDVAIALVAGFVASISITPINLVVLAFWVAVVVALRRQKVGSLFWQCFVMIAVLTIAAMAPLKTTDRILNRPIALGDTEMTLQQIDDYVRARDKQDRPLRFVSLTFAEDDKDRTIAFPSTRLTLREFVSTLEAQSPLRHRFVHCGNGWTLLYGGDCSFGLSIRDPELIGAPPRPRKVYDGWSK